MDVNEILLAYKQMQGMDDNQFQELIVALQDADDDQRQEALTQIVKTVQGESNNYSSSSVRTPKFTAPKMPKLNTNSNSQLNMSTMPSGYLTRQRMQFGGQPQQQPQEPQQGGQEEQIMQLIEMYCQITGEDPQQVIAQLQEMAQNSPEEAQAFLEQMQQVVMETQQGGGDPSQSMPPMEDPAMGGEAPIAIYGKNISSGYDLSPTEQKYLKGLSNRDLDIVSSIVSKSIRRQAQFGAKIKSNFSGGVNSVGMQAVSSVADGAFNMLAGINTSSTDGKGRERTNVAKSSVSTGAKAVQAASPMFEALDAIPIPGLKQGAQLLTFGIGSLIGRGVAKANKQAEDLRYDRQDLYDNSALSAPTNLNPYGTQLAFNGLKVIKDDIRSRALDWAKTKKLNS